MNILLVYPKYPDTYWSFRHALNFISKRAAVPPLGLITVSAMLPGTWQKKLVDMNVSALNPEDIEWADFVFISAMYIQKESVDFVIRECINHDKKIVAGGPLFTQEYANYPDIDYFVLNEAEVTLPLFLHDLQSGKTLEKVYRSSEYADLSTTPVPDYHLLKMKAYAFMNLQVSRGCPFACDFCEITALLGRKVRMKSTQQVINELDTLYRLNWKGSVFIVDDNFIGRKQEVKNNLLPAMLNWMQLHKYPFEFNTQSSINIVDDKELLSLMIKTGIKSTFIGIESTEEASLQECNKVQNNNRDLLHSVKEIQQAGMQVSGGFIVGFDNDTPTVFKRQSDFIAKSGIVSAMVGLLNAPKNTILYERLEKEKRLTEEATGSNTDFTMNFQPRMDKTDLLKGYREIIHNIYTVKPYYKRVRQFLLNYMPYRTSPRRFQFTNIVAFIKTIIIIGIVNRGRSEYWKFLFWTLFNRPGLFIDAVTYTVYGYHFRKTYGISAKG